MSREMIDEMAKVIAEVQYLGGLEKKVAELLCERGYLKQSEGEWIVYGHSYECSNCGFEYETDVFAEDYNPITDFDLHFCPECGARMKGGVE